MVEKLVVNHLRLDGFPEFLNSSACETLKLAKAETPKAMMVENEFSLEEMEELNVILGCQETGPVEPRPETDEHPREEKGGSC